MIEVGDDAIKVRYKDGSETVFGIGRIYGNVVDSTRPHDLKTAFKEGESFKEGDVLVYNKGFFEPDPLDKRQVLYSGHILAKVALMERLQTFEDSSVISERVSQALRTQTTKVRTVTVRFDQHVRNLVKVGGEVDVETILCTIEDGVTADNNLFDQDTLDSLKLMSANVPKAKAVGVVEKVEVFYNGDLEDMSDSLQAIAKTSDKLRKKRLKAIGEDPTPGAVDGSVRIDKNELSLDTAAIQIYITGNADAAVGDKIVVGNQLKSVIANVMSGVNATESGEDLDLLYSYLSISNRIVLSPEVVGTTTTLLKIMSQRVAEAYFKAKG